MIHIPKVLSGAIVCLLQLAFAGQIVRAEVIPYPRAAGDRANFDFLSVKIEGVPIDTVSTDMNVGYAHFAFSGAVAVQVIATETIETFDLSPHRYGIQATVKGNVLSFRLSQPRKLHLRINSLPRFFVFADAPEVNPPRPGKAGVYDIGDYGVTSSLESVQTSKIQRAIDDVAAKKGVLHVGPGVYQSGELKIKSNLTLYLAAGAVIKGTAKVSDYPRGRLGTQLIHLLDCENVRIAGRGVIDGRGRALRIATENSSDGRLKMIRSFRAKSCVVEDVRFRNNVVWTVKSALKIGTEVVDRKMTNIVFATTRLSTRVRRMLASAASNGRIAARSRSTWPGTTPAYNALTQNSPGRARCGSLHETILSRSSGKLTA